MAEQHVRSVALPEGSIFQGQCMGPSVPLYTYHLAALSRRSKTFLRVLRMVSYGMVVATATSLKRSLAMVRLELYGVHVQSTVMSSQ